MLKYWPVLIIQKKSHETKTNKYKKEVMSAKNMMLVKGEKTTMSHIYPVLNKITGLMVYRSSGDV